MNFLIFKKCLELIKPRIIFGNLIVVAGGFFLASRGNINVFLLFNVLIGTFLIIASGCVFNNIIDRNIDQKMKRTNNRVLAKKKISIKFAFFYGTFLLLIGLLYLFFFANILVLFLNVVGFLIYVVLYSQIAKPNSIYSTIIGGFSGSLPPIIGYSIIEKKINLCSLILFLIFLFWQVAHFYSISIFRVDEYRLAGVPIFSVIKGIRKTQYNILMSIIIFIFFSVLLYFINITNFFYFLGIIIISGIWLFFGFMTINYINAFLWSKIMFIFSIFVIFFFSLLISVFYVS
ncbi:heme o synthase [Buchnera aphidicola (Mindarus keteleerifoliae)]|uniref:heme o synthase n=1 Tax=Buchnera aphidicola TaxID=9 RepID=UPI0031B6D969